MTEPDRQPKKTIRQLRQERGWSQAGLAGRLRVQPSTIGNWEQGRTWPGPRRRQRLADLFGVPVETIAFGPAEPAPGAGIGEQA